MSYNSFLTLPRGRLKIQFCKTAPLFTPCQVVSPQLTHNFCRTWLQIRSSHKPLLGFENLLEWLTQPRKLIYLLLRNRYLLQRTFERIQTNSLMKRYTGQSPEVSWAQVSLWSWVHLSRHTDAIREFYGGFIILTHFPVPLLSLEDGGRTEKSQVLIMVWSF